MINFKGEKKKKTYFEGWYFKHQNETQTIAFIPGINIDNKGNKEAFIQIITNDKSYNIKYPYSSFNSSKNRLEIQIGDNKFSRNGIEINIQTNDISIVGKIVYGEFTNIKYNIMGPFSVIPCMECNHGIISLNHNLWGSLIINGRYHPFNNGYGYIEKDWGYSFPKNYLWIQCNKFKTPCSVMVSIADIPFMGREFKGCIAVVYYEGKEYRMATYNGVKIIKETDNIVQIKRGAYTLEIYAEENTPQALFAPDVGKMSRTIHENACCKGSFIFKKGNKTLFNLESMHCSFEKVYEIRTKNIDK